jgi:hypothetical protein
VSGPSWLRARRVWLISGLALFAASGVRAQEGSVGGGAARVGTDTVRFSPYHGGDFFFGGTLEDSDLGVTLGVDYDYRWHKWYSAGGLVYVVLGHSSAVSIGPQFSMHPIDRITVQLSPGARVEDHGTQFQFRVALGYVLRLSGQWTAGPRVAFDFVGGRRIFTFGGTIGRPF